MPTQYVEGEEEQLEYVEPFVQTAIHELARLYRQPVPDRAAQLLRWIAREAFRLGHQHAHDKNTVADELWPTDEVTPHNGRT